MAHRSRYRARMAYRLSKMSVVKNVSMAGGGLPRPGQAPREQGMPEPVPSLDQHAGFVGLELPAAALAG